MADWIVWAPMLAAVGGATVAKATLHREMRKLTQNQMESWSGQFMQQRMIQFGGIILVLCLILFVTSGYADRHQAMIGLWAAVAVLVVWAPISLLSTRKSMRELSLPEAFQKAVLIDKSIQTVLLALFLFYGFRNAGFVSI